VVDRKETFENTQKHTNPRGGQQSSSMRSDDATLPWPLDRQQVDAGTLTIDRVESDDTSPARDINFDPLALPNGIAASDDPLLSARSDVFLAPAQRRARRTPW
jgi:catalase